VSKVEPLVLSEVEGGRTIYGEYMRFSEKKLQTANPRKARKPRNTHDHLLYSFVLFQLKKKNQKNKKILETHERHETHETLLPEILAICRYFSPTGNEACFSAPG